MQAFSITYGKALEGPLTTRFFGIFKRAVGEVLKVLKKLVVTRAREA
jgi:hypothetical protein